MKRVNEPARRSLLDVIRKNLRAAGRSMYITRIVYIGEYVGSNFKLEERMESIIRRLQADYTNISITGMLLVYPQYYIHVLEAPEDIIYRHFKALYDEKIEDCEIVRSIFLPTYHHVHQRFFTVWFHVFAVPPTLIQKIESFRLEDIQMQMSNCYAKVYAFCDHISSTVRDRSVTMKDVIRNINDKIASLYPESTLLEYLVNVRSPVLMTVEKYLEAYSSVPLINLYSDTIWPPPRDVIICTFNGDGRKSIDESVRHRISTVRRTSR